MLRCVFQIVCLLLVMVMILPAQVRSNDTTAVILAVPAQNISGLGSSRLANHALFEMSDSQIDSLIKLVPARAIEPRQRLIIFSQQALNTPYRLFCLGEGAGSKYDSDPLYDFTQVDCMTFVEQMLALSISVGFDEMFDNLQRLRYRDGEIDIRTRNHYFHADWLPNNRWLLSDATSEIGSDACKIMTKTIDRRALLLQVGVAEDELTAVPPPQTLSIYYIPTARLLDVSNRLAGGEIASIVQSKPGIFAAHIGLIIRRPDGELVLRHASPPSGYNRVVDEAFSEVVAKISRSTTRVGMTFARINSEP